METLGPSGPSVEWEKIMKTMQRRLVAALLGITLVLATHVVEAQIQVKIVTATAGGSAELFFNQRTDIFIIIVKPPPGGKISDPRVAAEPGTVDWDAGPPNGDIIFEGFAEVPTADEAAAGVTFGDKAWTTAILEVTVTEPGKEKAEDKIFTIFPFECSVDIFSFDPFQPAKSPLVLTKINGTLGEPRGELKLTMTSPKLLLLPISISPAPESWSFEATLFCPFGAPGLTTGCGDDPLTAKVEYKCPISGLQATDLKTKNVRFVIRA